jgi:branched-chain amino acid transport system ATP-binding protein
MAILEIKELASGYGDVKILWGVSMELAEGKLTSLVGGNGVGKTTLLRAAMGQLPLWSGSVSLRGRDISTVPAHTRAEMGMVLVPEGRQLFTDMTVYENLEMGSTNRRARPLLHRNIERVYSMFPRLKERHAQRAGTLSGGEQQMLAVARGIMADPSLLIIDELSLGLAPVLVMTLFESLKQLRADGMTLLLVEQNVQLALAISDYGYVLADGKTDLHGPARQVLKDEHVRTAYLGM